MSEKSSKQEFGLWLRHLRQSKQLTQATVADISGLSWQHYNKIETGVSGTRRATIQRLAIALDTDIAEAFRRAGIGPARVADYASAGSHQLEKRQSAKQYNTPTSSEDTTDEYKDEAAHVSEELTELLMEVIKHEADELFNQFKSQLLLSTSTLSREYLERRLAEVHASVSEDSLTKLSSRLAFERVLQKEFGRSLRYGAPLSLMLLDVDDLGSYNKVNGSVKGDVVIASVAEVLKEQVRRIDFVARVAGDEFAIILPHTEEDAAGLLARRHRANIKHASWNKEEITVSIGLAVTSPGMQDASELVSHAAAALQQAKGLGGNKFVIYKIDDSKN